MAGNEDTKKKPLVFTDQRTKDKMDSHLTNIKDEITEADIANIKTDVTPNTPDTETTAEKTAAANLAKKEKAERGDHTDSNNSSNVKSSWNMLDEE